LKKKKVKKKENGYELEMILNKRKSGSKEKKELK
jgi:hypothetical protein